MSMSSDDYGSDHFGFGFDSTGRVDLTCLRCHSTVIEVDSFLVLSDLIAVADEHECPTQEATP